jgi:hypothetical protein
MEYLTVNTSIQLSDTLGNINHQGILASNINGTTTLTETFPTTSTGSSLGHYHYTEAGTNALKFLNVAGSGTGGHKFYTANSTTAPVNTATIGLDGLTLDYSQAGGATLVNLPSVISGQPGQIVFNYPPGLDTFGIQFGVYNNPVQVLFNSGPFVVGTTYYAQATNAQTLIIRATPNPSDPALNCSSFTFGQVPFAYVSGSSPTVSQVINMFDTLSITTNNDNSELSATNLTLTTQTNQSILSATSLTFNSVNVKMNQVQPTLIYSSPAIYADGQAPATSLTIRNTYGYSGWYFKNISSGQKINWYFPPKNATNTLVSDLKGVSISFFNGATTSNDNTLFITIYTRPTGSNDYAPGFFHSANTYIFDQSITPVANTNYQGVCIIDKSLVPHNYETQIQYQQSPVNNPRGNYQPTDNILAVTIGSNSASPTNSVEFVVNKLNLHYADFTQSYLLVSP